MNAEEIVRGLFHGGTFAGMRAIVFGTFYEEILREWFRSSRGYDVLPGKPQILWSSVELPEEEPEGNLGALVRAARRKQQTGKYALPDGLFLREGKHFVWEAKNWIPELWDQPFRATVWEFAWLLATKVRYLGADYDISGFIVSWWDPRAKNEEGLEAVRAEVEELIRPRTLEIVGTREILVHLVGEQPDWFREIAERRKVDLDQFFGALLGGGGTAIK